MIRRNQAFHYQNHRARLDVESLERRELLAAITNPLTVPLATGIPSQSSGANSSTLATPSVATQNTIATFTTSILASGAASAFTETLSITITFSISVTVPDVSAVVAGPGAGRVASPVSDSPVAANGTFTTVVLLSAGPGVQGAPFIYPYSLYPLPRVAAPVAQAERIPVQRAPAPDQGFFIVGDEKTVKDAFDADLGTNPQRPPVPAPVPSTPQQAPLPTEGLPDAVEEGARDAALAAYVEAKSEAVAGFADQLVLALEPAQLSLPQRSLGMAAMAVALGCGAFQGTVLADRNRVMLPRSRGVNKQQ